MSLLDCCCLPEFRPATGIFREVAPILLRLGKLVCEFEIGGGGGGADEMGGVDGLVIGVFDDEFLVAGPTTEIVPPMTFPLLGFLSFIVMKSPSRTPNFAFCPLWSNTFRSSSNAAKLFCIFIGGLDSVAGVNDES